MNTYDFFYRFEGVELINSPKKAGFTLLVDTDILYSLSRIVMTPQEHDNLICSMQTIITNSGLVGKKLINNCGAAFLNNSFCPKMFTTDPIFGGSIGANPEELLRLGEPYYLDYNGPIMSYTAHNVDNAKQAIVLMLLVQVWSEFAYSKLLVLDYQNRRS